MVAIVTLILLAGGVAFGYFAPNIICNHTWQELFQMLEGNQLDDVIQGVGDSLGLNYQTAAEFAQQNLIYSALIILAYIVGMIIIIAIVKKLCRK